MTKATGRRAERSTARTMRLGIWLALTLGRALMRLLLIPIVAYFLLTGREPAHAARRFLRQALGREPGWIERMRHWYTYAAVLLDRIFLLADRHHDFAVQIEQHAVVTQAMQQGRGVLVLVSHFGSFEVMRVIGRQARQLPIRIVLDRSQGAMSTALLEALNPGLAAAVIDASQRGPALALALKQALDQGDLLGMMADRVRSGQRTVAVQFMNRPAHLPEHPWILASVLQVPVILAFGIYQGGNRYRIRFEHLAEQVVLPRATRRAAVQVYAQAYADRLETQVRAAPYNWFNFYDFWADETAADH
ncbi:lipid A biosynthesis acyltransferase [Panacagrimonas sp.]|uniref:LpxL/LpxP family acyltransferase n=1 Tax=Panacagrimonas sp. TaxID=2480088 RepID=UPI003B52644A